MILANFLKLIKKMKLYLYLNFLKVFCESIFIGLK